MNGPTLKVGNLQKCKSPRVASQHIVHQLALGKASNEPCPAERVRRSERQLPEASGALPQKRCNEVTAYS